MNINQIEYDRFISSSRNKNILCAPYYDYGKELVKKSKVRLIERLSCRKERFANSAREIKAHADYISSKLENMLSVLH